MDIQQLKLLAGRVRGLLEQKNHIVSHNQALDLISALPGLRNWPEAQAFPDRVAACELDSISTGRMAFRLKKKFDLVFTPQSMLVELSPPEAIWMKPVPQIWPGGPASGVYVTTSQDAINALLAKYEEATDGALVYAERAGNHWAGSIDLGESGLWSNGLERVPSGTLLIVGPLTLDQRSWENTSSSIEMACLLAQASSHRVAALIKTPSPEMMHEDIRLMVKSIQPQGDDADSALCGIVTVDGELQRKVPFAKPYPPPVQGHKSGTTEAIPPSVRNILKAAVSNRKAGLLFLGSSVIEEHSAIDLVVSVLNSTEHAGPAARIMPRDRSTPAKDWLVPDEIKQLPFLPSIQSAYAQGYRRMIVDPNFTDAALLLEYGEKVLFIAGTYGSEAESVFMSGLRGGGIRNERDILPLLIAVLGVKQIPTKRGVAFASDLFIGNGRMPTLSGNFLDIANYLQNNRILKWQEEMTQLLDSRELTTSSVKKTMQRNHAVLEFLKNRS